MSILITTKAAPPVAERPQCPGCSERLKPFYENFWEKGKGAPTSKAWSGRYQGYGEFCTLRCAKGYASFMFKRYGTMLVVEKSHA